MVGRVRDGLAHEFSIDRIADTYLDRFGGKVAEFALPGLVFWMTRGTEDGTGDSASN